MRRLSSVMAEAPMACVWLIESNEFIFANDAMITGLGFESLEDLQRLKCGTPRTWRGLLDTIVEQAAYDQLMERSRSGEYTDAYWCTVRDRNGGRLCLRVHGERVPFG